MDAVLLSDSADLADRYVADNFAGRRLMVPSARCPDVDDGFCARVADAFERLVARPVDGVARRLYTELREETRAQFDVIVRSGVRVRPWQDEGQPYTGARDLYERLRGTGVLYVYLTDSGHGSGGVPDPTNPLLDSSDVVVDGLRFRYNDLFRAVHDFFGHGMFGDGFSLRGELRAAFTHFQMFTPAVHRVLFTEFVAQICWFYCGSHLIGGDGVIPRRGQVGWWSPPSRPYAPQRMVVFPAGMVADFLWRFRGARPLGAEDIAGDGPVM